MPAGDSLRLLILDDNSHDLALLEGIASELSDWPLLIATFSEPNEVDANRITQGAYDVLLVDHVLGEERGIDIIRRFREAGIDVPIVLMTGQGSEQIAAEAMRSGADDYIVKADLSPDRLRSCLNFVLTTAERRRRRQMVEEELIRLATVDELTGVYNRRYFMERFEEEVRLALRHELPMSLLMLDLDYFKSVNDSYGHVAGDCVLHETGETIRRVIRNTDLAGRYGGEEFAILLPMTNREGAAEIADRLREAVAEMRFAGGKGRHFAVTCSVGVAELAPDVETGHRLIELADQALYRAKEAGRNRVM